MPASLISVATLVASLVAHNWGVDGHRLICQLAWERLTPVAQQYVTTILAADSLPAPFPETCLWADTVRATVDPESRPYHSRLSPTGRGHPDLHLVCEPPQIRCGPWAIRYYVTALADSETTPQGRVAALKFVAHLVGDVHQPLHEGHLSDRGGRDIRVSYHGLREPNGRLLSLHRLWDDGIMLHLGLTYPAALPGLRPALATPQARAWEQDPLNVWIREGEALADTVAYRLPPHHRIDAGYEARANAIIIGQLQRAAVRLAYLLNHLADGTLDQRAFEAMS